MTEGDLISIAQNALTLAITASAPILIVSLVIGLLISIFQATTQINDQSMVFVPKIIGVLVTILVIGPWMMNMLVDFTNNLFMQINTLVK